MRNEDSCKAFERYLIADSYLPEHAVKLWQDYTEQRFLNKDKNDFYHNYVSWKQKHNQIAVFTTRSYADLEMNKKFDCIFNYDNLNEFVFEKFEVIQSIYECWAPINCVEDGHGHLLILEFENEVPQLLYKLHKEEERRNTIPKIHTRLGFCTIEDFPFIKEKIKSY